MLPLNPPILGEIALRRQCEALLAGRVKTCERQLTARVAAIQADLERNPNLGGKPQQIVFAEAYRDALENLRDGLVQVLKKTTAALAIPRSPELAGSLVSLFGHAFIPAGQLFQRELAARFAGIDARAALGVSVLVGEAKADLEVFAVEGVLVDPPIPHDHLRAVELALRGLVKQRFSLAYGDRWLREASAALSPESLAKATATMKQRHAYSTSDLLDFTQLKDVLDIVADQRRWQTLFRPAFAFDRTRFNSLASVLLKGRTEHAHHRPPRHWPAVERARAEIAAYDLLEGMVGGERLSREADRAYFPFIRATRFLYRDDAGKQLRPILCALFDSFEVAVENAVSADTFEKLVEAASGKVEVATDLERLQAAAAMDAWPRYVASVRTRGDDRDDGILRSAVFAVTRDRNFVASAAALNHLQTLFERFKRYTREDEEGDPQEQPRHRRPFDD